MQILILGIGNSLLSDEGIGVYVVNEISRGPLPEGVHCLDGGTLSFTLADEIGSVTGLIVVDAARMSEEPGSVRVFENEAMDCFLNTGTTSVHEVGLADLLDIARLTGRLPTQRALVGVQPLNLGWGVEPTEAVKAAVPLAITQVNNLVENWRLISNC